MIHANRIAILLAAAAGCCAAAPIAAATAPTPLVSTGHSQWAWASPTPQGENLSAVAFRGDTGYAVGAFGTILRSDDAGQTWSGLASGTTDDLDVVQQLGRSTVVAAGSCSAFESTDGGGSFRTLPLGLGHDCSTPVAGIAFTDARHGYVELRDGTLFYTDDGGRSLQARSAPSLAGLAGVTAATGLAFSSPSDGLAVSSAGQIEQTTDGGNSWSQVKSAARGLNAVTIVSPTLAYAVGYDGELERSTDGGATWKRLALALHGGGAVPNLESITCTDAGDCLMSTSDSNVLVRTADGGRTGTKVSVSNDGLAGVAYAGGTTVVGVGQGGTTVISHDAGRTFPTVTSNGGRTPAGPAALLPGPAARSAYLFGGTSIEASADAGRSWQRLRVPTTEQLNSVAFASARVGYALDSGGVLRVTRDGGRSWSSFAQGHSPSSTLLAPTPRSLLLVGPRGVFRSTHNGSDFRSVRVRVRVSLHVGPALATLGLDDGFAAHGVALAWSNRTHALIESTDGGAAWRSIPAPPFVGRWNISVGAAGRDRLYLLGSSGVLWTTGDGGRHWDALSALGGLAADGASVSFSSPRDGLVALAAGSSLDDREAPIHSVDVLRTADGGRTWTPEVIAGGDGAIAISVAGGAVAEKNVSTTSNETQQADLFTTAGAPAPVSRTRLTVAFARRRLTARALAAAGHRVLVTGRVSPAPATGGTVALSYRLPGAEWKAVEVRVASGGAFRYRVAGVRTRVQVVAQALGTSAVSGAGTPVQTLSVSR